MSNLFFEVLILALVAAVLGYFVSVGLAVAVVLIGGIVLLVAHHNGTPNP